MSIFGIGLMYVARVHFQGGVSVRPGSGSAGRFRYDEFPPAGVPVQKHPAVTPA